MQSYYQQIKELTAELDAYGKKDAPMAAYMAANETMEVAKNRAVKGVAAAVKLPVKAVKKRIYVSKKASLNQREVKMRSYYRGVSVISAGGKDTGIGGWKTIKGQVKRYRGGKARRATGVKTGKAGGNRHFPHAFVAKGKKGNVHAFIRLKSGLRSLYISIYEAVNKTSKKAAEREFSTGYEKRFVRQLERRLKLRKGKI